MQMSDLSESAGEKLKTRDEGQKQKDLPEGTVINNAPRTKVQRPPPENTAQSCTPVQ